MKTKFKVLVGLLVISVCCGAQTVEIEAEILNRGISEKKWDLAEMQERARIWKIERVNYPKIPYDTVLKKAVFQQYFKFDGITKVQAFKRCKEWAAFKFNKLDAVIEYEDIESGKLILEGYVEIPYIKTFKNMWGNLKSAPTAIELYFSLMITMVDGKAKVTYHNLRYRTFIPGFVSSNVYIPAEYYTFSFDSMFPMIEKDFLSWGGAFDLVRNSLAELNGTAPDLEKYVNEFKVDYKF